MNNKNALNGMLGFVLLGFMVVSLMDQQRDQQRRLRTLRKKMQERDGLAEDLNKIRGDWNKVRLDLENASAKALNDVQ